MAWSGYHGFLLALGLWGIPMTGQQAVIHFKQGLIAMLTAPIMQTVEQLTIAKRHLPGALLPILHDIQHGLGYVPDAAVPRIAQLLNLSRAEVHGVLTFYHFFRRVPAGQQVVQICRAEACQSMGADKLWAHACSRLKNQGGTTTDGASTLEPVYCLGLCSSAPAMALNDKHHARVDSDKFDRLLAAARSAV